MRYESLRGVEWEERERCIPSLPFFPHSHSRHAKRLSTSRLPMEVATPTTEAAETAAEAEVDARPIPERVVVVRIPVAVVVRGRRGIVASLVAAVLALGRFVDDRLDQRLGKAGL